MTVHYQNRHGDMVFISGVIHLQNAENGIFRALMPDGAELTLLVDRIEGIYYEDRGGEFEMIEELKPCPFCGSSNVFVRITHHLDGLSNTQYEVRCNKCSSTGGRRLSRFNAIEVWNTRLDGKGE